MISIEKLKSTTDEFFNSYCNKDLIRQSWSDKWNFYGTLPFNNQKGCYAHLVNDEVVYIGLAIGNSFDGSGIGARVSKYWKKSFDYSNSEQKYTSTVEDVTSIITLPFLGDTFYLAAALEVYLIQRLEPPRNKIHSRKN